MFSSPWLQSFALFFSPLHVLFLDVHSSSTSQSRTTVPRYCSPGIKALDVLRIYCPLCWIFRSEISLTFFRKMLLNWLHSKQRFNHDHSGKKRKDIELAHLLLPMIFYSSVLFGATFRCTSEVENSVAKIYSNDPQDSCHCMAWCPTVPVERRDAQIASSYIYKRMKLMIITEISGWVGYAVAEDTRQRSLILFFQ